MARVFASLAVLLATCVLVQHFVVAASSPVIEERLDGHTKPSLNEEELEYELDNVNETDLVENTRVKRAGKVKGLLTVLGKVLPRVIVGTSILTSGSSLGFELYLKQHGCCGIHEYAKACANEKIYRTVLLPQLLQKGRDIDHKYTDAKNILYYVKECNFNNKEIWLAVKKLRLFVDTLVNQLDIDIIPKFENETTRIKHLIEKGNRTIDELLSTTFNTRYNSLFDTAKGTAQALGGILGEGFIYAAYFAFNQYKINKISQALNRDFGAQLRGADPKAKKLLGFTHDSINSHLRETAKSRYNAEMDTSRVAKWTQRFGLAMTTAAIGLDIWQAHDKIVSCRDAFHKTEDGIRKANDARVTLDGIMAEVSDYRNNVSSQGWDFVRRQLVGEKFNNVLKMIANVTKYAAGQTKLLKEAHATVLDFASKFGQIPDSDYKEVNNMQKKLIKALTYATFPFACYDSKVGLVNYVERECRKGAGSMRAIFDDGAKSFPKFNDKECRDSFGVPYSSFEDIVGIVNKTMRNESLQTDCILNSKTMKENACFQKDGMGLKAAAIALAMKITTAQAEFFTRHCPPRTRLTPKEVNQTCALRRKGLTDEYIATQVFHLPHLVEKVKNVSGCPTLPPTTIPPLTQSEKDSICSSRKKLTNEEIARLMSKPLYQVEAVVCPTTALTTEEQARVCTLRPFMSNKEIANFISRPEHLVAAVKCPTTSPPTTAAPLTEKEKADVCRFRSFGLSEEQIASLVKKPPAAFKDVTCPRP